MILKLKNKLAAMLAIALLFALTNVGGQPASAADDRIVPNGSYEIDFRYVVDGASDDSRVNNYAIPGTGVLTANGGVYHFSNEFDSFSYFKHFSSRQPGSGKAVIVSDTVTGIEGYRNADIVFINDDPNHVTASFEINDLNVKQDLLVHVVIPEIDYDHWYNVQLELDTSNLPYIFPEDPNDGEEPGQKTLDDLLELITVAQAKYLTVFEGTGDGFYLVGTSQYLHNNITIAELTAAGSNSTSVQISAAYAILDSALKRVEQNLIIVNKSQLGQLLDEARNLHATMKILGETRGGTTLVSEGEYTRSPNAKTTLNTQINNASPVYDDIQATQAAVDAAYNTLRSFVDGIEANKAASSIVKLAVLDAEVLNDPDAAPLVYAEDQYFDTEIQHFSMNREYVHLTLRGLSRLSDEGSTYNPANIRVTKPVVEGHLLIPDGANAGKLGINQTCLAVLSDTENDTYTCQIILREYSALFESESSGIVQFWFDYNGDPSKTVLLNFNVEQAEALQEQVEQAVQLLASVDAGSGPGQYPQAAIDDLEEAIEAAALAAGNPIAIRRELAEAAEQLAQAVSLFEQQQAFGRYFTVAHATAESFSHLDSYFEKPAVVESAPSGSHIVTLTIQNSSELTDLKIANGSGGFDSAAVVEEEAQSNTRVVSFPLQQLSGLINAKATVAAAGGAGGSESSTIDIRFNFNDVNNTALRQAVAAATALHGSAVVGSQPGQYPGTAKSAFQTAIAKADKIAVNAAGTQTQTDEALALLNAAISQFQSNAVPQTDPNNGPGTPGQTPDPVYPADGNYYIDFVVLKNGTNETSVADGYLVSPALVKVSGNGSSKTVSFTVRQHKEITGLRLGGSSGSVSGVDSANNTRVVTFSLSNLSSVISGWVKIDWAAFNYFHEYDIQFKFNEASARFAGSNATVPGSSGNAGPPPGLGFEDETDNEDAEVDEENEETEDVVEDGSEDELTDDQSGESESDGGQSPVKFTDLASHWAKASIDRAVGLGIVNGYPDGSFRPNDIVTRGEFAAMISRALKLDGTGNADSFSDYGAFPAWARDHIGRAAAAGLIGGFEDQTFRFDGQLTRAQLAVIIARAAGLEAVDDEVAIAGFKDAADIPSWAQKEIAAAVKAGLVLGKGNGMFDPNATATRAEALTLIIRLLDALQ